MKDVTKPHEEKETLAVDVFIPGHEERVTTELFRRTRIALHRRENSRCAVCGRTAEESGHPLEAHHHPIERSLANMIDWTRFRADCEAGVWGQYARAFDWSKFDPAHPESFVDDMTANGLLVCKDHHTGKDEGIHCLPFPLWVAQKYGREGYRFTATETIHHEDTGHDR